MMEQTVFSANIAMQNWIKNALIINLKGKIVAESSSHTVEKLVGHFELWVFKWEPIFGLKSVVIQISLTKFSIMESPLCCGRVYWSLDFARKTFEGIAIILCETLTIYIVIYILW